MQAPSNKGEKGTQPTQASKKIKSAVSQKQLAFLLAFYLTFDFWERGASMTVIWFGLAILNFLKQKKLKWS